MAKAQILIVEDDNITVMDLRDRLQGLGYTVAAVASYGEEAIKKAAEMRPDLVLMDIRLKGAVDGIEAAEEIHVRFDIPVVYLTAYADENTLQRAKVTEPYGYIIKPLEERELHTAIEVALYKHKVERKLKESERWLATTLRSIGDAVIATDEKGLVTFMNPVAEALTGWKQEKALGKDLTGVFNIVNEQTRTLAENPATRAMREGIVIGLADHSILIAKDGEETPIDDSAAPIRDDKGNVTGVVLVFRDISDRKRAEEALRESEERYRTTINAMSDLVHVVDRDLRLALFNEAFLRRVTKLGIEGDLTGKDIFELFPFLSARVREEYKQVLETGEPLVTEESTEVGQRIAWTETRKIPILDEERRAHRVITIVHDITDRKRAEQSLRQHTAQLEALRQVGLELTAQLDLAALLHSIVSRAVELVGGDSGGLYLYRPERDVLEWAMAVGPNLAPIGTILQRGEGLSGKVWETGEPLIVDDYQAWGWRAAVYEGYPFRATVGVPIRWGDKFLGVLDVLADPPHTFSSANAELLSLFATQAAIAIENARLYEESQRRALEQETVSRIAYALNTPDVREAFPLLVEGLQDLTGCDLVNLVMIDEAGEQFITSVLESPLPMPGEGDVMPLSATAVLESLKAGCPHLTADLSTETHFPFEQALYQTGLRSRLTLPLLVGGEVFGALNLGGSDTGLFREDQLPVLQQITDALALALQNSFIFQAEQKRRHIAETLRQASTVLSSTLELDEVLGLILEQLQQVIPYDSASVQRLQHERLEIVVCQGFEEPDKVVGLVFPLDPKFPNYHVITTKAPLAIEDVIQDYPHFKEEADSYESGRIRSWLGVPLIVKGEVIGMIAVDRQEVQPYTTEETQLAMAFANQAAMAIENARLYQEAKHLSITDGLTGLYNRRHFYELLEREVGSVNRYDDLVSLIMLDIDGFKAYNDTYGHLVGDALLGELVQILARDIRQVDIAARYGGDEFVIFLPHTDKKQAVALAERIKTSVEGHRFPGEEGFSSKVTISLGVAACPEDAVDSEALVKAADMALLEAKKQGNRVCAWAKMG